MSELRTRQEAREWFDQNGKCISQWAAERGFERQAVYEVLRGRTQCTRGKSHEIAVALQIKRNPSLNDKSFN